MTSGGLRGQSFPFLIEKTGNLAGPLASWSDSLATWNFGCTRNHQPSIRMTSHEGVQRLGGLTRATRTR